MSLLVALDIPTHPYFYDDNMSIHSMIHRPSSSQLSACLPCMPASQRALSRVSALPFVPGGNPLPSDPYPAPLWYHTSRLEVVKHNQEEGLVVEVLGMGSIAGCGSSGYGLCGRVLGGKYALWFWYSGWDSGLVCLLRLTCVAVRFSGCRPSWKAVRGSGFGRGWDEFPRLDWLASFLHSFFGGWRKLAQYIFVILLVVL